MQHYMQSVVMTNTRTFIAMLLVTLQTTLCTQNHQRKEQNMRNKKILVTFFSRAGENYNVGHIEKGNTHIIAEMIVQETGATLSAFNL